jgi:DNA repair exonuclease SbcCD ATPase subunit
VYFTSGSAESIYASMTPSILVPIWLVAIVAALPLIFISYWRVRNLILNGYRKKMEKWKKEGYEVSKLKEVLELKKDLKLIKSKFTDFEEGIKTLKQLKEELLSLDSKGFESEADAIKEKLKDAEKIHAIIEEIKKLKVEIEKRKKIMEECRAKKEKWKKEGYDVSELEGVC